MNKEAETYEELIRQKRCIDFIKYYNITKDEVEKIYQFLTKYPNGIVSANTSTISKYALGGVDENKEEMFNLEEITYSQYGNKKYLIGLGGYDGTNITINNEAGEKVLNPNIKSVQEIINSKAELIDGKLKAEQLPKLNNITAATTTEDMITKFNDLLTDLKAKGYMTADITA